MARRPMIMRRCSTGSPRNTTAKMPRWSPSWRPWVRPSLGVPGGRFLGGGTDVRGGRDGGPAADRDPLAGTLGGALGASLAGSVAGAEALLRDIASDLEVLW